MATAQQLDFFQHHLQDLQAMVPMEDAKAKRKEDQESKASMKRRRQAARQGKPDEAPPRKASLEETVQMLARLSLRHEDMLNRIKSSVGYVLYLQPQSGLLQILYRTSQEWKQQKESPTGVQSSLRLLMLGMFLRAIKLQAEGAKQQQVQTDMQNKGLMKEGKWVYRRWNNQAKQLETDNSREAATPELMITHLDTLLTLMSPENVTKFSATRPLAEEVLPDAKTTVLLLELAVADSTTLKMKESLAALAGSGLMETIHAQMKMDTLRRSGLAEKLSTQARFYPLRLHASVCSMHCCS